MNLNISKPYAQNKNNNTIYNMKRKSMNSKYKLPGQELKRMN